MISTNNTVFEAIRQAGYDWTRDKAERKARKAEIIKKYGWDSEELKAWYAEDETIVAIYIVLSINPIIISSDVGVNNKLLWVETQ